MGVSWSLAVEEQFYLILPFIIRFLSQTTVGWVSAILVFSGPLIRVSFLLWHPHGEIASYVLLPARWDAMFLGVLGALAIRSRTVLEMLRNKLWTIRIVALLCSASLAALCLAGQGIGSWGMCLLGHSLLALMSLSLLLLTMLSPDGWAGRFFTNKFLTWVGTISYGIYLLHQPIAGFTHGYLLNQSPQVRGFYDAGVTLIAVAATFSLATLSSRYLEAPVVKLGQRCRYKHDPLLFDSRSNAAPRS